MKKKILIALGLIIIVVLAVLYSFPDVTESYFDKKSTAANSIGYLVKDEEVRLEFLADQNNLGSIALKIGTFGRTNLTTMDVQILDEDRQQIAQKSVDLMDVTDNAYCKISFKPIAESGNKIFTVIITSPDATNENSVALYTNQIKGDTTRLYINGEEQAVALSFRAAYYGNFDIETLIVLLFFIAVVFCFVVFIYKFL